MAGYAVNPAIFRAYDIRGLVGSDLSDGTLATIGRAAGTLFRADGARRIVVGRDARASSPVLQAAFQAGLRATGVDVIDIGAVPTPVMAFATTYLRADGGAVISASHNPPEYNGVKLRRALPAGGSEPWTSAAIQELQQRANGPHIVDESAGALEHTSVDNAYIASVANEITIGGRRKVVLDGGNGVAGPLAMRVLEACGVDVVPLYIEPDSSFPNHAPDPSHPANLRDLAREVVAQNADIGLALDGDGDRLGVVDSDGTIVAADRVLLLLARYLLRHEHATVVCDVMCSSVLDDAVRTFGGELVRCKTGYSHLAAAVRATNAVLGGERSGHIIAARTPLHRYDDGTFAGARVLEALAFFDQPLALLLQPYPPLAALPDERWPCADETKGAVIAYLREHLSHSHHVTTLDGVRIDTGDGWGIVRASNTEPLLTARFEARTYDHARAIRAVIQEKIEEFHRQGTM